MHNGNLSMGKCGIDGVRTATTLGALLMLSLLGNDNVFAQNVPFGAPPPPPNPADELIRNLPPPTIGLKFPQQPLPPDAPQPSSDPRNFEGTWFYDKTLQFRIQKDMYGDDIPFKLEGAKLLVRRVDSLALGTPYINASTLCRAPGQVWQFDVNNPFQIYQTSDFIEIPFQMYHTIWRIALKREPAPVQQQYMGHSVAHWDGDTLVVETSGFKQDMWLDVNGTPASKNAKLTQRIRKILDQGSPQLEVVTTIDDPKYYERPWSIARTASWRPDMMIFNEFNCEEQVGDPRYLPASGLVPEPKE